MLVIKTNNSDAERNSQLISTFEVVGELDRQNKSMLRSLRQTDREISDMEKSPSKFISEFTLRRCVEMQCTP